MTLQEGIPGREYIVESIELPIETERRLEALGLIEGGSVFVLRKKRRGAMIVKIQGARFALGLGISKKIQLQA